MRAALSRALEASALEADPEEAVRLAEQATRLDPLESPYWADLGAAYEAANRIVDARRAYQQAVHLFPNSPRMNWRLGNFLLRQEDVAGALDAFRKVVEADPAMRRAAFQTAWAATESSGEILERMLPPQPDLELLYLNYLVETGRLDAAGEVWPLLIRAGFPYAPKAAFPYLDALLTHGRAEEAIGAWQALTATAPSRYPPHSRYGNRITNGGFEYEILNGGLDWRISTVDGAVTGVAADSPFEGALCLQASFAGTHNVDFSGLVQYVPVEPDTRYVFTARVRAGEITSDSGPRFRLTDAASDARLALETSPILGSMPWTAVRLDFRTAPETRVLVLRLVRPRSRKFDGRISGTLWVDDVRLEEMETLRPAARR